MQLVIDDWRPLAEPESADLISAAAEASSPAEIERLRRIAEPGVVAAAIELGRARRRCEGRLRNPGSLVLDQAGASMASSFVVATHKARRFRDAGRLVYDLCCGVGGDAMGLTHAGCETVGLDLEPTRAWMASHNAGVRCVAEDVTRAPLPTDALIHLDPARRSEDGRRSRRLEDLMPGLDFVRAVADRNGAIKLAPGVEPHALPPGELEIISERGTLTQGVLWTGGLAGAERTATLLAQPERDAPVDAARAYSVSGTPRAAELTPRAESLGRYVYAVDPAPERAELLGEIAAITALGLWHPRLGVFTGNELVESPWLTAFELLETADFNERRVAKRLAAHDAGIVEVKTRGQAVDPDTLQARLRGTGSATLTLFVLRYDRTRVALITKRV